MTLISDTVDKIAWFIFRALNLAWTTVIALAVITGHWHPLKVIAILLLSIAVQHVVIHLWNYGLHRETEEEKWDNCYWTGLATRDKLNRRATFCWMLGMRKHALMLIEHADFAWLDAQLVLADEENPRNVQPLRPQTLEVPDQMIEMINHGTETGHSHGR